LTFIQWVSLIKLFELEISVRKMTQQMGLSYNTVYSAIQTIRYAILSHAEDSRDILSGEIELDESYFGGRRKGRRGRGAAGKVPVFGILERNGVVSVTVVPNVSAETLIGLTVKKVRRGSIIYTDKFKSYDSLMYCGYRHLKVDHQYRFASGKVYINGLEGFWSWAKERLIKHHGVSPQNFPLYLKELSSDTTSVIMIFSILSLILSVIWCQNLINYQK
jgi:transposase